MPSRAADLARAQRSIAALSMTDPDWDQVREALRGPSWRSVLLQAALRTVTAGAELYAAVRGRGYAARDRYEARYRRYFRTETRLLRLLKAAALLGRPRGVRGEHRTRHQLLKQASAIEAALVAQGFYTETTDEKAARGCVRIGLGIVHHLVSGASLPADCSPGHDW